MGENEIGKQVVSETFKQTKTRCIQKWYTHWVFGGRVANRTEVLREWRRTRWWCCGWVHARRRAMGENSRSVFGGKKMCHVWRIPMQGGTEGKFSIQSSRSTPKLSTHTRGARRSLCGFRFQDSILSNPCPMEVSSIRVTKVSAKFVHPAGRWNS